ncbi:TetR/AcrR family transcriptional regulator [Desulfocicer niacini]
MSIDFASLKKSWDGHINELINVTAKKTDVIEKKHEQIVAGALKVFLEKGYHPATIREISEAAGMSLGQLYHYVSSKDDVLFLIQRHLQIGFLSHMNKIEEPEKGEDSVQLLLKSLGHAVMYLVEHRKQFQFIYTESKYLNKRHLQVVLQMDDRNIVQYWRKLLDDIRRTKNISIDIDLSANLIAYLTVFIPMRGWNLKNRSLEEQKEIVIDFIMKGIGLDNPGR